MIDIEKFLSDYEGVPEARDLHGVRAVIEQLQSQLAAEQEANRWIPVGERLPNARNADTEYSEKVQVCHVGNRLMDHDWYLTNQKCWQANPLAPYTHWRPARLPKGQ